MKLYVYHVSYIKRALGSEDNEFLETNVVCPAIENPYHLTEVRNFIKGLPEHYHRHVAIINWKKYGNEDDYAYGTVADWRGFEVKGYDR